MEDGSSTPIYRAFPLTNAGAINTPAVLIDAVNDDEAVSRARSMVATQALELWDRARFVAKIEPVRASS